MPLAIRSLFRTLGRKKCDIVGAGRIGTSIDRGQLSLALDKSYSSTYLPTYLRQVGSSISLHAPKLHTKGLHDMAHRAIMVGSSEWSKKRVQPGCGPLLACSSHRIRPVLSC